MQLIDRLIKKMRPYSELLLVLFFLVALIWLRLNLSRYVVGRVVASHVVAGPKFWPTIILNFGILCAAILTLITIKNMRSKHIDKTAEADENNMPASPEMIRLLITLTLTILYVYLLPKLGFIIATFVFGFSYFYLFKIRNPLVTVVVPLSFVIVILIVFTRVLSVPLPRGLGILRELSFYIY